MDVKKQTPNGTNSTSKQQHPTSSGGSSAAPVSSSTSSSAHSGSSQLAESLEGGLQKRSSNGRSSKSQSQGTPTHTSPGMTLNLSLSNGNGGTATKDKNNSAPLTNGVDSAKIFIKKEPDTCSLDVGQHHHCSQSPTTPTVSGRRLSLNGKEGRRSQRISISQKTSSDTLMRSFSMSDDLEDDLKLSAADCMGGVISTPPIKPLEEGDDIITTPSPPTSAGMLGSIKSGSSVGSRSGSATESINLTGTSTTTHSTVSTTSAGQVASSNTSSQSEMNKKVLTSSGNVKDTSASLMQELNDFSKILDEVEMEQRANEERLVLSQPPAGHDVFRATQSRDMVATPHVARPTHLISPPPYYVATTPKQTSQQFYNPTGQLSYANTPSMPHRVSSVQDPSLYVRMDYRRSLSHQQHMTPAQVDPAIFAPRPDQMHSEHIQRHPQLQHISAVSPQVHQQPPSLRPVLASPTVRLPLPHTPVSSHMPPFPDPAVVSSVATPTLPPHTPTTPLEHFNSFPAPHQRATPPSQIHSPTHPQYVPPPPVTAVPISSTAFPFANLKVSQDQLRSPTVTSASFMWTQQQQQPNTLRDKILAQVNSQIEARISGQKRLSQDAGFPLPPPTKMAAGSSPFPHPTGHNHMTMQPPTPQQQQQQQQQYLPSAPPTAPPTGSSGAVGYTGLSQHQQQQGQLIHTISYQAPGGGLTSAPPYPHHHM